MFNSNNGYSLADIAAATGGNDRNNGGIWNDGGAWWIIILFLFCFSGWGNGFGGFGGYGTNSNGLGSPSGQGWATRADINEGFAFQNLQSGINSIQQGICDSTYALNNALTNGFHGVDNAVCNLGYQTQQGFNSTNVALMQGQNALVPITPPYYLPDRDMDRNEWGRMYYPRSRDSQGRYTESDRGDMQDSRRNYGDRPIYYNEKEFPMDLRDSREGRSPMMRRMYMESKELHKDKEIKMKELDKYMKELSEDLVEMIDDASPEERQLLEKKISALATKISSLNHV